MAHFLVYIKLTEAQAQSLAMAMQNSKSVKFTLHHEQIGDESGDKLLFTKAQFTRLNNARKSGKSISITIS